MNILKTWRGAAPEIGSTPARRASGASLCKSAGASAKAWAVTALLALALAACGGGSESTTTSPITTASAYTSGTISGFGSIIVNGVRFDDSVATVLDDDGVARTSSALKLGASVEIESGAIDQSTGRATATTIRYGSELLGPVEAIDTSLNQFTLLGQVVEVSSSTVYDSSLSGGLSSLALGAVLEVHAALDSARSVYVATRVEAQSSATEYRLRGLISSLDTTAQTFQIGSALISYASLSTQPSGLADGQRVRVKLQTTAVNGAWVATELRQGERKPSDLAQAEVHGLISAWTSATAFSVDGLAVDASTATFPQGQTGVVLGARVEVRGALVNGVLVATQVSVDDHQAGGHDTGYAQGYELHGALSALDTTAKTFTLRGVTVNYASVSTWSGLTEASLADGLRIEVKGSLAADGVTLTASTIRLDH